MFKKTKYSHSHKNLPFLAKEPVKRRPEAQICLDDVMAWIQSTPSPKGSHDECLVLWVPLGGGTFLDVPENSGGGPSSMNHGYCGCALKVTPGPSFLFSVCCVSTMRGMASYPHSTATMMGSQAAWTPATVGGWQHFRNMSYLLLLASWLTSPLLHSHHAVLLTISPKVMGPAL